MGQTTLLLASASPRRRELLAQLGLAFDVLPAEIDETPLPDEPPAAYVTRLAAQKAQALAERRPDRLVLAADTAVVLEGQILGKPTSAEHARAMLRQLSGRTHSVHSGVAVAGAHSAVRRVETHVTFRPLTPAQIRWYVSTGEPMDKAGAYAVQGAGGAFVERIDGSVSNVIGLPLAETLELLERAGLALPWSAP